MSYTSINQDFVIALIYDAAQYTSRNLEPLASMEWRNARHIYDEIIYSIPEYYWEPFKQDYILLKEQFGVS